MGFRSVVAVALAGAALLWSVAGAETVDKIVAVVNGEVILYSELQNQVRAMEKASPALKTEDASRREQLEREVLQQLIQQRLAEGEVKRLKIVVSPADVDNALKGIKQQNNFTDAQLEYYVSQEGLTLDQFRDKLKKDLERNRMLDRVLKSKTIITDEQVDAYLKTGKSSTVEQRRIAILFLKQDSGEKSAEDVAKKAREIRERLKGGADFARIVKENSQGPAVEEGGDIGFISTDELAPAIEQATRGLGPNQITDVVQTPGGCYIFKVLDVRKQSANDGDSAMKDKARRQLFQEEVGRKFDVWIKELESKAFIQIFL
jgi:peptidyl-prolyl cis-trans isomerase SurA